MKSEWDRCRPWIEAALQGSGWTFEEIKAGGERGLFHLFAHPEGCMVGEFIVSPRSRVMHIFAAGGSLESIKALLPQAEAFGRANGCDCGGATGRKGWERFLRQYGYRPASPAVEKEF